MKKVIEEVKLAEEGTLMAEFQAKRTKAISEMFDNLDKCGIYPTGKFFVRLDKALEKALAQQRKQFREMVERRKWTFIEGNIVGCRVVESCRSVHKFWAGCAKGRS